MHNVIPVAFWSSHTDGALFQVVRHQLKLLWSPQQIALKLKVLWPNNSEKSVSHETIYNAIYMHPRGELKRELIACLRHLNQVRKPRSRGDDRRYQIQDMQSIHIRPPEVEDLLIPGHWEGDLIKGAGNPSSVGTLVEHTTGFVVLAKMDNATTKAVVDSFAAVLNREPAAMRKTMTYDQGREMHGHKILTERYWRPDLFRRPAQPVAARVKREHQWPAAPVHAERIGSVDLLPRRPRCHRTVAQYTPESEAQF
jgi:IS30 family transposase